MLNHLAAPINDADLADVKAFVASGRPIPAIIAAALIARLESSECGRAAAVACPGLATVPLQP